MTKRPTMTVGQLIAELQKYDETLPVRAQGDYAYEWVGGVEHTPAYLTMEEYVAICNIYEIPKG